MKNSVLYNCCSGNNPPDWFLYRALRVAPCRDDPTDPGYMINCDESEAEFWTVYGELRDNVADELGFGECEAITDCYSREQVESVAAILSKLSGLPIFQR